MTRASELVERNQFIGGEAVDQFEREFARYCGAEDCVALNSGTDALRLALLAQGLTPEDEVITSPFTFFATGETIRQVARLRLADIDPETFTLDPEAVGEKLNGRTRVILPVHIFGLPADLGALSDLTRGTGIELIEDACQAHGSAIQGRRVGSYGVSAAFSFYPSKNLGAFGDAGALTCSSTELADRIRLLRNHGQVAPYRHDLEGYNSRMDTLQAALLNLKLCWLEEWNEERRKLARLYTENLATIEEISVQKIPKDVSHAFHIFALRAPKRDELLHYLRRHQVDARVVYPVPLHRMKAFESLGLEEGGLPECERLCREVLCLPLYPGLAEGNVEKISGLVRRFFRGSTKPLSV